MLFPIIPTYSFTSLKTYEVAILKGNRDAVFKAVMLLKEALESSFVRNFGKLGVVHIDLIRE